MYVIVNLIIFWCSWCQWGRPRPRKFRGRWFQTTYLSPLRVWIPPRSLDSFMWKSCPANLLNVRGSTLVPICAWNNAQEGTWGLPLLVKLESCHMTLIVLMKCKSWHPLPPPPLKKKERSDLVTMFFSMPSLTSLHLH
jgi:hypothetical protein